MADKIQVPDEYLRDIGEVALRWNVVENTMNMVLIELMGLDCFDLSSHAPFAHMPVNQKLDVISSLVKSSAHFMADAMITEAHQTVLPLIREAQAHRNKIIHSSWAVVSGDVIYRSFRARGTVQFNQSMCPPDFLREAIALICEASDGVWNLFIAVRTSRSRLPPRNALQTAE